VRPVTRIAVRYRKENGKWKAVVLISALSAKDVLALTGEPQAAASDLATVLHAYVTFYDQRGGGVETSLKEDKSGLGLTKRSKKRFPAQQMLVLLSSLAHNVLVWARGWLTESADTIRGYGMLRMTRDVLHVSGFVLFDQAGHVQQIILNQCAPLARFLSHSLRDILSPLHISVHLGQTS